MNNCQHIIEKVFPNAISANEIAYLMLFHILFLILEKNGV